jgi:multiple sugar transport system substrate-binding protein
MLNFDKFIIHIVNYGKKMIDKHSGTPLYQQIRRYLVDYINDNAGQYKKIPSENELSVQFGISRPTIRQALDSLAKEDLIEKIPGKGTFIKSNKKDINFTNWQSTEKMTRDPLEMILKKLTEKKSNISINNEGIIYKDMIGKLMEMTGHGKAPDIMAITYSWIPLLVNQGALFPMNEYYTKSVKDKLYPQSTRAITYKGNYYGFNWGNGPHILYYNREILEECFGVPDLNFSYYDELAEYLFKIKSRYKGEIIPMCLPFNNNDLRFVLIHFLYIFLFSFNGGIVDENGDIILNSNDNVDAFKWLKSFIKKGSIELNLDINKARKIFAENKMAFWIDGPWFKNMIPTLNKKGNIDLGFKILPKTPKGLACSSLSNHVLSVSNQCKDKETAAEIIKYITMDKWSMEYYYKQTGMLPSSKIEIEKNPAYDDKFGNVLKKQMRTAQPIPDAYPGFSYSLNFCARACKEIFIGDKNIISVLNNTAEAIKEIYVE